MNGIAGTSCRRYGDQIRRACACSNAGRPAAAARCTPAMRHDNAQAISAAAKDRYGTSLLVAMRPWELAAFDSLRRTPDTRAFMIQRA